MYIYNAFKEQGYSAFSLFILEYIDISNLEKPSVIKILISEM